MRMKMCRVIVEYLVLISHGADPEKGIGIPACGRQAQFDGQFSQQLLNCVDLELVAVGCAARR